MLCHTSNRIKNDLLIQTKYKTEILNAFTHSTLFKSDTTNLVYQHNLSANRTLNKNK